MIRPASDLESFLKRDEPIIVVETQSVAGSAPREEGSFMLVSADAFAGTVGGGALEFRAICEAQEMLRDGRDHCRLPVTLGPKTDQCCGGQVSLMLRRIDEGYREIIRSRLDAEKTALPMAIVFGAGHVGSELAQCLARLPLRVHLVDSRSDAFGIGPPEVTFRNLAVPEEAVREAPPGSAYIVMTHDHGLDFLITSEALRRDDTAYVGLIGSKTKKARFRREFLDSGGTEKQFARLVSPIGGHALKDKRPAVIAALATAEIAIALLQEKSGKRAEAAA